MKKYNLTIIISICLFATFLLLKRENVNQFVTMVLSRNIKDRKIVVVIDPGHGGRDPGKVGINNAKEKDINLSISFKLKKLLVLNDLEVILTREDDQGLYNDGDTYKKRTDLNKRIEIINKSKADLVISIHQNSFEQEAIKGAQVFYHSKSEEGKKLASLIQEQLKTTLQDGNHRTIKPNNNYYMLKNTDALLVLVECGYLSNYKEAELLLNEDYQEKVAWAIHLAVMNYVNSELKN